MNKKYIGLFLAFIIIIVLTIYKTYTPLIDIQKANTKIILDTNTLIHHFVTNETLANEKYKSKIIEVKGSIKEITYTNNRKTIILQGSNKKNYIICDMENNQTDIVKKLSVGQVLQIKGICKGFLNDVILLNCMIINH